MFFINFAGFFQVRLPTDPDPTDEKRGVSGYTFAIAGEEDLDRIIRLHNPVNLRTHAPKNPDQPPEREFGVFVTSVAIGNEVQEDHPLVNAKFDLLGDAKFEMLNYILTLNAGTESIYPFIMDISGGGIRINRTDYLDPDNPSASLYDMTLTQLERRGGALGPLLNEGTVREITRCNSGREYREKRLALLKEDLAVETDPVTRAGIKTRIREIEWPSIGNIDWENRRTMALSFVERRNFEINGPAIVEDPENKLGVKLDPSLDWPIQFWNGVWDCDALVGYMRGTLQIPIVMGSQSQACS